MLATNGSGQQPRLYSGCFAIGLAAATCVLLATAVNSAYAVTIDWVTVGDAGNAPDPRNGNGAVSYQYQIGKYEVTLGQYCEFLNAAAKSDPYRLYEPSMPYVNPIAGISRMGVSGSYSYGVVGPVGTTPAGADSPGNRPMSWVTWFSMARFANWLTNGQGSGSTETGAYTISTGQITAASRTGGVNTYSLSQASTLSVGDQVAVGGLGGPGFNVCGTVTSVSGSQFTVANTNADAVASGTGSMTGASAAAASNAKFRLPTLDEWYKAACYSPILNSGSGGYWFYATQSNVEPGSILGGALNQANCKTYDAGGNLMYAVTQSSTYSSTQNYLTNVGAFTNSASYYGTFDQGGNVNEMTELITGTYAGSPGGYRAYRGGDWNNAAFNFSSPAYTSSYALAPNEYSERVGFRLASPIAVPEPSTYAMALSGLAFGGFSIWRQKRPRIST